MSERHSPKDKSSSQSSDSSLSIPNRTPLNPHIDEVCVEGVLFYGGHAGIKSKVDVLDVGLIVSLHGLTCSGVFTQNQVVAAPVTLSKKRLQTTSTVHAVVVNSGNAKSADIENLIKKVKKRVYEKTGINLELEIKIIGE